MLKKSASYALAILLILVLCLSSAHAEETTSITIETTILSAMDLAAYEWYEDTTSKTALAACIWCDVVLSDNDQLEAIMTEAIRDGYVYVAKEGLMLAVIYCGENGSILAIYQPSTDELSITDLDTQISSKYVADVVMEGLKDQGLVSTYSEVEGEDILTVLEIIMEMLEE